MEKPPQLSENERVTDPKQYNIPAQSCDSKPVSELGLLTLPESIH